MSSSSKRVLKAELELGSPRKNLMRAQALPLAKPSALSITQLGSTQVIETVDTPIHTTPSAPEVSLSTTLHPTLEHPKAEDNGSRNNWERNLCMMFWEWLTKENGEEESPCVRKEKWRSEEHSWFLNEWEKTTCSIPLTFDSSKEKKNMTSHHFRKQRCVESERGEGPNFLGREITVPMC